MSDTPAQNPDKKPYEKRLVFMGQFMQPFLICALFFVSLLLFDRSVRFAVTAYFIGNHLLLHSDFLKDSLHIVYITIFVLILQKYEYALKLLSVRGIKGCSVILLCGAVVGFLYRIGRCCIARFDRYFDLVFLQTWIKKTTSVTVVFMAFLGVLASAADYILPLLVLLCFFVCHKEIKASHA